MKNKGRHLAPVRAGIRDRVQATPCLTWHQWSNIAFVLLRLGRADEGAPAKNELMQEGNRYLAPPE